MIKTLFITLSLVSTINVLSQAKPRINSLAEKPSVEKTCDTLIDTSQEKYWLKKLDFPATQKVAPKVIYIVNDKAVSREEFLKFNKAKQ